MVDDSVNSFFPRSIISSLTHISLLLEEAVQGLPIALKRVDNMRLNAVMSNSFGFGGTNATLVFQRYG